MKCFVLGCKSSSNKRKNNEEKRSFFTAPKDEELFRAWQKAIPQTHKVFERQHMLCDLHFQTKDVLTEFVHHMPGGNIVRFKRDKIKLNKGTVPSIFTQSNSALMSYVNVLILPDEIKKQLKENNLQKVSKPPSLVCLESPSKKSREITSPSKRRISAKSLQYSPQSSSQLNNCAFPTTINISTLANELKMELKRNNSEETPGSPFKFYDNNYSQRSIETSKQFSSSPDIRQTLYLKLCEEIRTNPLLVPMPTGLWISNRISTNELQCIMWCLWKEDASRILKRITIFGDMTVEIFIDEKPVSIPDIGNVLIMQDIARILSEVSENIIPCSKVDGRKSSKKCPGYVRRRNVSLKSSFQDDRCVHCTKCLMSVRRKMELSHNVK